MNRNQLQTMKGREYYQEHKDQINACSKKYYQKHREQIREYNRKYSQEHKDERKEYAKKYRQEHPEKIREKKREYYEKHKDQRIKYSKKYGQEHRERYKEQHNYRVKQLKLQYVLEKGGKCERCGYNKNYSALTFHHSNGRKGSKSENPENKSFDINMVMLVCENCHREIHHPYCILSPLEKQSSISPFGDKYHE